MSDRDAQFREFVDDASPSLLRTARLLTGDWYVGEDVLQAALLRVYARWNRAEVISSPHAYTRRVMVTLLASWRRRRWNRERPQADPVDRSDQQDIAERVALHHALDVELARLPQPHRTVLVLRFYEDLSVEQTAEVLGCSTGTVKSRTSRALHQLRGTWNPTAKEAT